MKQQRRGRSRNYISDREVILRFEILSKISSDIGSVVILKI